jgi:O-antigen/teichoic acid export membrane protein
MLSSLTGFISFPIFTRIFSTAQYGILGLIDSTFKFAGTLSGMGLRPAVVRLWGEFKSGQRDGDTTSLASTMLSASFLIGAVVSILFIGALFLPDSILPPEARRLIAMSAVIILFRNLIQMVLSIIQSQEKAATRSGVMLAQRYLLMGLPLIFVAVFRWGLTGFFAGVIVAEGLVFIWCLRYALVHLGWRPRVLDSPLIRESMLYGLPLLGLNVSGFVTDWGDRFLLNYFRDAAELGLYTAGYNMAGYATMFFVPALNSALIPVTMNVWSEKGPDEARSSLETFLRYYALVALPIVFGVSAVAHELIGLMASDKYLPAATVIPWVLSAKVVQGAYYPFLAGLFLTKRTGWLAVFMAGAGVMNIALNWFLIPSMGMKGAAIATVIAYAFYVFGGGLFSQRYLKLSFPWRSFLAYLVAGGGMFLVLGLIPTPQSNLVALLVKVPAGMIVYVLLILVLDGPARSLARQAANRLLKR